MWLMKYQMYRFAVLKIDQTDVEYENLNKVHCSQAPKKQSHLIFQLFHYKYRKKNFVAVVSLWKNCTENN